MIGLNDDRISTGNKCFDVYGIIINFERIYGHTLFPSLKFNVNYPVFRSLFCKWIIMGHMSFIGSGWNTLDADTHLSSAMNYSIIESDRIFIHHFLTKDYGNVEIYWLFVVRCHKSGENLLMSKAQCNFKSINSKKENFANEIVFWSKQRPPWYSLNSKHDK